VRLLPEPAGNLDRINVGLPPPRALVVGTMNGPVMPAAKGNRELIADLAVERTWLSESEWCGSEGLRPRRYSRSAPVPSVVGNDLRRFDQSLLGSAAMAML